MKNNVVSNYFKKTLLFVVSLLLIPFSYGNNVAFSTIESSNSDVLELVTANHKNTIFIYENQGQEIEQEEDFFSDFYFELSVNSTADISYLNANTFVTYSKFYKSTSLYDLYCCLKIDC